MQERTTKHLEILLHLLNEAVQVDQFSTSQVYFLQFYPLLYQMTHGGMVAVYRSYVQYLICLGEAYLLQIQSSLNWHNLHTRRIHGAYFANNLAH